MQLSLELERGDRRREANRRQIAEHMGAAGWRGLAVEIVIYAANESPLEAIDGARWLVCRLSERRLAAKLGAGKSGVHEALERLAGGELVERGVGMFRVAWDRVCELEAVASWVPLPAVECEPPARSGLPSTSDPSTSDPSEANSRSVGGRSEGGRKVVGYWNQEQETSSSIHPIQNQEPTRDHTADRRPTADRPTARYRVSHPLAGPGDQPAAAEPIGQRADLPPGGGRGLVGADGRRLRASVGAGAVCDGPRGPQGGRD